MRPLAAPPELLTEHLMGREINELVRARAGGPGYEYWRRLDEDEPRAVGRGWYTDGLSSRSLRLDSSRAKTMCDLEIADNGTLTLFVSRLSFGRAVARVAMQQFLLDDDAAISIVRGLVELAGALGTTYGYQGPWQLAVGMTNLAQVISTRIDVEWADGPEDVLRYGADDYLNATTATTAECRERPGAVTRRLMYRLVRALGTADLSAEVFA